LNGLLRWLKASSSGKYHQCGKNNREDPVSNVDCFLRHKYWFYSELFFSEIKINASFHIVKSQHLPKQKNRAYAHPAKALSHYNIKIGIKLFNPTGCLPGQRDIIHVRIAYKNIVLISGDQWHKNRLTDLSEKVKSMMVRRQLKVITIFK
jgi:hypothetical protein